MVETNKNPFAKKSQPSSNPFAKPAAPKPLDAIKSTSFFEGVDNIESSGVKGEFWLSNVRDADFERKKW